MAINLYHRWMRRLQLFLAARPTRPESRQVASGA
jgi:hypothetical protein